jgi:hypothetical protein
MRLVKRMAERLLGTWREGPEPPARLRDLVLLFATDHPYATRRDWVDFTIRTVDECYRSGYIRGIERAERDPDARPWADFSPEEVADRLDPEWLDSPELRLDSPVE